MLPKTTEIFVNARQNDKRAKGKETRSQKRQSREGMICQDDGNCQRTTRKHRRGKPRFEFIVWYACLALTLTENAARISIRRSRRPQISICRGSEIVRVYFCQYIFWKRIRYTGSSCLRIPHLRATALRIWNVRDA